MSTGISRNEIFLGNRNTNLDKQKERIESLRQTLCEVKEVTKNNIYKVTEREEKLKVLSDKIDNLKETTQQFSSNATKLRKKSSISLYSFLVIVVIMAIIIMVSTLFAIKTV
uniref:V-SNARE coiled-coil homology domain-containing protein n=1 Tax=Strongyloides papillosus TaxID=174720 RepID=A0A0N5C8N4_STREA